MFVWDLMIVDLNAAVLPLFIKDDKFLNLAEILRKLTVIIVCLVKQSV